MLTFSDKVAWVVGASRGIGAAVARELAARGARVAISARDADQLAQVSGGRMVEIPADVTDPTTLTAAVSAIQDRLGALDLVIISAGYWKQVSVDPWDTAVFDRHVTVNLSGLSNTIAAVLPGMLQKRSGVIAGIASVAGYRGLAGSEAYGATKAAQINLLESLRIHLHHTGVRVTTVCPGFVRTDLTAANRFPMPFLIEPDQAAMAICDGLARQRTQIVFPLPMAVLMNTARLVPASVWTALWTRRSPR